MNESFTKVFQVLPSVECKFWSLVEKSDGCWNWNGNFSTWGYGRLWAQGISMPVHRLSYFLENGTIPEGLLVCHRCDNKKCVRPSHLFLGTHNDNSDDKIKKGRAVYAKGEQKGNHKLTNLKVVEMRQLYSFGGITQREIAKLFKVSKSTSGTVLKGTSWKHVST